MYTYTGYLNNFDTDMDDQSRPLLVSGCGIYRLVKLPVMETIRPKGRLDYQLLYVSSGKAFFDLGEETIVEVSAGSMVLYRPGEPQRYWYCVQDRPEVCWIHFTGSQADRLLSESGFEKQKKVLSVDISSDYPALFRQIIRELQLKRPCFEEFLPLHLGRIFAEIHRSQKEHTLDHSLNRGEIAKAVHEFNESFAKEIYIRDYAAAQHMSVCWFIRSFRAYMGVTPMQYITSLRITRAKELLRSTSYSIQEISTMVGYENPLYFSRIFKKQTGSSPKEYRSVR